MKQRKQTHPYWQAAAILFVAFFSISCGSPPKLKITQDKVYEEYVPKAEREYHLGPGDIIEIVYHYTPKPDASKYHLAVGDIIKVEFAYHKEANRQLTVRPDGNISMPRVGDVNVLGLTPSEVQSKITRIFAKDFKDPVVTITMVQYNRAIDHLKRAITTAPRGQSKLTAVRPDGYITFPIIDDILASGRSLPEVKEIASREYNKLIDNLTITLILKVMKSNLVYVMGEVENPGTYIMEGARTVSQIMAKAGGIKDTGESGTVLVVSRTDQGNPWGRLVDVKEILETGNIGHDITLHQYDIVYVPKTRIARADLFVEQYITRIMPNWLRAVYDVGGSAIEHDPILK